MQEVETMKKWLRLLCIICLCSLLLTGCIGTSEPNNPASPGMTQGTEPAVSPQGDVGPPDHTQAPTPALPYGTDMENTATPDQP